MEPRVVEWKGELHMLEGETPRGNRGRGGSPERGEFGGPRKLVWVEPAGETVKALVLLDQVHARPQTGFPSPSRHRTGISPEYHQDWPQTHLDDKMMELLKDGSPKSHRPRDP